MKSLIFSILVGSSLTLGLAACSPPSGLTICPTLVPYSKTDQQTLATELRTHPDLKQTPRWIADYIGLRDQVRACQR